MGVLPSVQVGVSPVPGGPIVPEPRVWVPDKWPVSGPELGIVVSTSREQLTGMYWPRNKMTGWLGSLLHCEIEAMAPGENPVPLTLSTVPLAIPMQTGASGFVSLHDAPGVVDVKERVMPDEVGLR
jgi:hypothetical protein